MISKRRIAALGLLILTLSIIMCLTSCIFEDKVTYSWYDADGTLLFEETIGVSENPIEYNLPEDSKMWDYTKWQDGEKDREKIACRVPQNSYFVGNVFQIVVQDLGEQPIATGSAFVFNSDGWFITNAHVIEGAYYAQAIFNIPNNATGESFTYLDINEGTYYHLDKDIYIGKIEDYSKIRYYYKEIPFNMNYEIGDLTYSVGYPNSSAELVINEGEITENWSDIYEKLYSGHSYICSSSELAPGSSGGILVNGDFEVIGITTLGWFDDNDKFISGASISAFNFSNILNDTDNIDEDKLASLVDRFHIEEKAYIGFFNEAKTDFLKGEAEEFFFDDGTLAYKYEWSEEGVNDNRVAYTYDEELIISSDFFIIYTGEIYWQNGDRRTTLFYGYYDHKKGLDDFAFEFEYAWGDGDYYTVKCDDINYSANIALTLNKCVVDSPYYYEPTKGNVEYAKKEFNSTYKWLDGWIAKYE